MSIKNALRLQVLALGALVMAAPVNAATIYASASAGNLIGAGPFLYGPYTTQHIIENNLPSGNAPGYLNTSINGVRTSGPGTSATRLSVSVSEPQSIASAYADLRLGKIGAFAGTTLSGFSSSSAMISDSLNFNISGANDATVTPLRFLISLHATALDAWGLMTFSGYTWYGSLGNGFAFNVQPSVVRHQTWLEGTTRFFDLTYNLSGVNPSFFPSLSLEAIAGGGTTSDFSNTAGIKIIVPQNATFTSQSGQFLASVSAVPEPASWAMMIFGFGIVGAATRRHRAVLAKS